MQKAFLRKIKSSITLLLILSTVLTTVFFLPQTEAQTVTTLLITPVSGNVGTIVQATANITTIGQGYQLAFDNTIIDSRNATLYSVSLNFTVPEAPIGTHNVTITDVTTGNNDTRIFNIETAYILDITPKPESPAQLQEGSSVQINATITGGEASTTYNANITIQTPNQTTYTRASMLGISTSALGSGNSTTSYAGDFPTANTSLVGQYRVLFNSTLANATFNIELTNSTEYHRNQTVDIKALYQPDENVTITITGKDVNNIVNATADQTGIVNYAGWPVPANASIGTYTVNVTSITPNGTLKSPPDLQTFTVPGYAVNVTTRNLARELISNVNVTILEDGIVIDNKTSGSDGVAFMKVESGSYVGNAYYQNTLVGEQLIGITGAEPIDFFCNLTNLRITVAAVVNGTQVMIPEAELYLARYGVPPTPENQTSTNITGTAVVHSLLPNINYLLVVSRYQINFTTIFIGTLLDVEGNTVAWYNLTVPVPDSMVEILAVGADGNAVANAVVRFEEAMGGLFYEQNTDAEGKAAFNNAYGMYSVKVYDPNGIKLNETQVSLFANRNITMLCQLYNLTILVRVIDYFGQPLANMNVTLHREGLTPVSSLTQSDGKAMFNGITGGDVEVSIYLFGQSQPFEEEIFAISNSTTVNIGINKYFMLAGSFVDVAQFVTVLVIILTVLAVLSLELLRRRRLKPQKTAD